MYPWLFYFSVVFIGYRISWLVKWLFVWWTGCQTFWLMGRSIGFLSFCFSDCCLTDDLVSFFIWFTFYPFKFMVSLLLTTRLQCDFKFEIEPNEMRHRGLRFFLWRQGFMLWSCGLWYRIFRYKVRKVPKIYCWFFQTPSCLCFPLSSFERLTQSLWKLVCIYHGNWAHLSGVLHKSLPSVCMSLCISLLLL
jgi:hypothetical protein